MSRYLGQSGPRTGSSTAFFADWSATADDAPAAGQETTSKESRPHRQVDFSRSRRVELWQLSASVRRRTLALSTLAASAAAVVVFAPGPTANADPSPHTWYRLRMCESSNNYKINTGNGYYGAYQFSARTWQSLGFTGLPSDADAATQDLAAQKLQARSGWGQWPACSRRLHLR